jgi:trans-aconitate methyltransferase
MSKKWDGRYYKQHSQAQTERAVDAINSIPWLGNEHVVDLGCGNGKVTRLIAERVPNGRVLGLDHSISMIEQAIGDYQNDNLSFVVSDIEQFSLHKEWNYIVSFNALHWVEQHDLVLESARQSLMRQGRLHFLMAFGKKEPAIDRVVETSQWKSGLERLFQFRARMASINYPQLLRDHGFVEDEVCQVDSRHEFSSCDSLACQIMTWLPHVSDFSEEKTAQLAQELARSFAACSTSQGSIIYTVPILRVRAHLP